MSKDVMRFQKESSNININVEFSNESTWMEATDNFIGFLHMCGYMFDPADVADYIMEQYDVTSGITFDVYDKPFDNPFPESCGCTDCKHGFAMCSPNCTCK